MKVIVRTLHYFQGCPIHLQIDAKDGPRMQESIDRILRQYNEWLREVTRANTVSGPFAKQ